MCELSGGGPEIGSALSGESRTSRFLNSTGRSIENNGAFVMHHVSGGAPVF